MFRCGRIGDLTGGPSAVSLLNATVGDDERVCRRTSFLFLFLMAMSICGVSDTFKYLNFLLDTVLFEDVTPSGMSPK